MKEEEQILETEDPIISAQKFRAGSSAVEQGPYKSLAVGAIPSPHTI